MFDLEVNSALTLTRLSNAVQRLFWLLSESELVGFIIEEDDFFTLCSAQCAPDKTPTEVLSLVF